MRKKSNQKLEEKNQKQKCFGLKSRTNSIIRKINKIYDLVRLYRRCDKITLK